MLIFFFFFCLTLLLKGIRRENCSENNRGDIIIEKLSCRQFYITEQEEGIFLKKSVLCYIVQAVCGSRIESSSRMINLKTDCITQFVSQTVFFQRANVLNHCEIRVSSHKGSSIVVTQMQWEIFINNIAGAISSNCCGYAHSYSFSVISSDQPQILEDMSNCSSVPLRLQPWLVFLWLGRSLVSLSSNSLLLCLLGCDNLGGLTCRLYW